MQLFDHGAGPAGRGLSAGAFEGNPRALRFYKRWGSKGLAGSVKSGEGLHLAHRILASDPSGVIP